MIDLRLGRWQGALLDVEDVDALIVDPPFSARTHQGHDAGVRAARLDGEEYRQRVDRRDGSVYPVGVSRRKEIAFDAFDRADVAELVEHWSPRTRGWMCIITDHIFAPFFAAALKAEGRYVFSPLACVDPGRGVRLCGDGPSQWSVWLIVARPKGRLWASWGARPGAYVRPQYTPLKRAPIVGGKPEWLMRAIVRDYSKPGDLICDPCAGSGTTLLAAIRAGCRAVGAEMDPDTYQLARDRLAGVQAIPECQMVLPWTEEAS